MKSINKLLAIVLLSTIISPVSTLSSFAQDEAEDTKVELNKISCRELLKMPGKDRELTLVFFHGLMAAKNNQMVIDRVALREATNKITDYCIDNPNSMLMTAFDRYL
ncbi:HdeA/HdeB family chaperone [Crocosphaera sp.]|uniref:HdeA/HdeB family chaperone n=1 Tax=Crocosphaera sp. TaxID=2729996 RepID=UPI0026037E55|nr:HdeA/HdeB family chaperone [Crocosphaera sp.]MDJ0579992.1 HdeA/HdeB family chaperone [Crocosphaera sp.]